MRMLSILFLLGMDLAANLETCPSDEEMIPCTCQRAKDFNSIKIVCRNERGDMRVEDLVNPMKHLSGKKKVEIEIKNFDLREMPFDFFQGTDVVKLSIDKCEVPNVNEENQKILIGLENSLERLMISYSISGSNDLSKLSFAHLRKLKQLVMFMNNLPDVHAGWFQDSNLEVLKLYYNQVVNVEERAFAGLKNLKMFEFRGEKEHGAFQRSLLPVPADRLTKLELDYNDYESLEEDIFSDMPVLNEVWLTGNRLRTLDRDTWEPVWEQLDYLYILNNRIECDSDLEWTFGLRRPKVLSGMCEGPRNMKGRSIGDFIDNGGVK